ncbi:GGDEF domain-containing protein [Vibrio sp. HN007]|uniref:GGDEF domain-containing protein n=1 Tax=Vibrio iocasae TaxID=3098914 RepID=UPI0035D4754C
MLDPITSVLSYGIAQLACAIAMLLVGFWNPSLQGVKEWGIGRMLIFLATVVIAMRETIPLPVSSIGGHFLFLLGAYIIWDGYRKFLDNSATGQRKLVLTCCVLFMSVMVYGSLVHPSFAIRMNVTTIAGIFFLTLYTWQFHTTASKAKYRAIRFLKAICVIAVLHLVLRLLVYTFGLAGNSLASAGNLTAASFVLEIFLHVLISTASLALTVEYLQKELTQAAERDQLTGAYNRRSFFTILEKLCAGTRRDHAPMAVCYIDLDHFKDVNDQFGHRIGDLVLQRFVAMVESVIRERDLFARFGGEEFVVVLPDTELEHAQEIAERIREQLILQAFPGVPSGYVTCSIGVSAVDELSGEQAFDSLLERSDNALYNAKRSGRNMVCTN